MKAEPVAGDDATRGRESGPPSLAINRIELRCIAARIVVDNYVSIDLHTCGMRASDELHEFAFVAKPRLGSALLTEIAEVVKIIRVVAHRLSLGRFVCRWQPEGRKSDSL